jgi:hypothetical protein
MILKRMVLKKYNASCVFDEGKSITHQAQDSIMRALRQAKRDVLRSIHFSHSQGERG